MASNRQYEVEMTEIDGVSYDNFRDIQRNGDGEILKQFSLNCGFVPVSLANQIIIVSIGDKQ